LSQVLDKFVVVHSAAVGVCVGIIFIH